MHFARKMFRKRTPRGPCWRRRKSSVWYCCNGALSPALFQFFQLQLELFDFYLVTLLAPNIMRRSFAMIALRCSISESRVASP